MRNNFTHHICLILCLGLLLAMTTGCKHAENATSSFRLNENRASTLVYMAEMIGSCQHSITPTGLNNAFTFQLQRSVQLYLSYTDEQLSHPDPELQKIIDDSITTFIQYTLMMNSTACQNSTCADLGYIVMKYPAEFALLNHILAAGKTYEDTTGELQMIAEEAEYKYDEFLPMLLDAYNLSAIGFSPEMEEKYRKSNTEIPWTKYEFPLDFGTSQWDNIEFARTIVELERLRCPIASEGFVTRYLRAIDKLESQLGYPPQKYSTYYNRLTYFAQFSFLKAIMIYNALVESPNTKELVQKIANNPEYAANPSLLINVNDLIANEATFSRIIPGYNELYFYGSLIAAFYNFPEKFILMHLQYPDQVAEFYRHIRDHMPIYSIGTPNADTINLFFTNSSIPAEFGNNPFDIIMIAKYWCLTLPLDTAFRPEYVRKTIDRVIQAKSDTYQIPQQYATDFSLQQYFSQFVFYNINHY